MFTPTQLFILSTLFTLPLAAADDKSRSVEPLQGRIIQVQLGKSYRIWCAPLMVCTIHAPEGEKFIRREIGDMLHFPSPEIDEPTAFYSVKVGFPGFSTSLFLETDKGNGYPFQIMDAGRGESDLIVVLKSGDDLISKRIAGPSIVVSRAEYELSETKRIAAETALAQTQADAHKQIETTQAKTLDLFGSKVHTYQFDHQIARERPWQIDEIFLVGDIFCVRRSTKAPDLPTLTAIGENGKSEIVVPKYDPDTGLFKLAQPITSGYFSFGGQKKEKKLAFHLPPEHS